MSLHRNISWSDLKRLHPATFDELVTLVGLANAVDHTTAIDIIDEGWTLKASDRFVLATEDASDTPVLFELVSSC